MKECFGQLANMSIRFRDSLKQHYLRVDDEKLKECDKCPLFTKCMFLRNNELMREMLKLIDENAKQSASPLRLS
jgi:uncharacterized protein YutE (UPF0331/DUF86 family)